MYLERELGWPQVRWYGWVKRQRKRWRSGGGVRKKSSGLRRREIGNAQAAQSVGTWSLGDRKLWFLGVRRDLPRRPQSCAKDRRASP